LATPLFFIQQEVWRFGLTANWYRLTWWF